jgi:hypothetical protein
LYSQGPLYSQDHCIVKAIVQLRPLYSQGHFTVKVIE